MERFMISITREKREYKEDVTDEAKEHFDECVSNGANPHLVKLGWDEWTKEIIVNKRQLEDLNGKHFLFGWIESFMQSDDCPDWMHNDTNFYEFYVHEDGEKK